ncbi:MAG: ATP-binding protein [Chitinispirillaceae bacterium]|nr:ATP-binding protein [Chitinispirillaceae bacterium]
MNNKEISPFTPGCPVPVELFVGRAKQIEELLRYARQILSGKQENIFLIGDRGIGKSSLSSFCKYYVSTHDDLNLLGIHVFLGRVTTLEEMVHHIFEQILKETKEQSWFKEIAGFFGKYIEEIGLFGISVRFSPKEDDLKDLVRNFPLALNNLLTKLKGKKKGLFIALDDINGLAEKEDFANWYKSFVDEVATHYKNFPVVIVLIGQPEKRDILSRLQPSLMRIFRVIEIEKLSDEEVEDFLSKAFLERAGMKVDPDALQTMVHFSSGLPIIMHEIGDATFWIDNDWIIDSKDAINGVLTAAEKIGQKYLDPKVYREIRSLRYRSILRKIVIPPISRNFEKKEVEKRLDTNEKSVFHNFLRKFRELGVIEPDIEKGRGFYKFVNEIYPVYIWMESERAKKIKG